VLTHSLICTYGNTAVEPQLCLRVYITLARRCFRGSFVLKAYRSTIVLRNWIGSIIWRLPYTCLNHKEIILCAESFSFGSHQGWGRGKYEIEFVFCIHALEMLYNHINPANAIVATELSDTRPRSCFSKRTCR